MVKTTIGAKAAALTLVPADELARPLGYPGAIPWDAPAGPTDPQPFSRMPVPGGDADVVSDPTAWTVWAYLVALQGSHAVGLGHGTTALAAGLGISEARWHAAAVLLEQAGVLERRPSTVDGRAIVHIAVNPADDRVSQWVRIPLGLLISCAPVGTAGAHAGAPRLWARIACWQGYQGSTRQLLTAMSKDLGCQPKAAARCVADLERYGWLTVVEHAGRSGHTYSTVDPTGGVSGAVLAEAREAAADRRAHLKEAARIAGALAVARMRDETALLAKQNARGRAALAREVVHEVPQTAAPVETQGVPSHAQNIKLPSVSDLSGAASVPLGCRRGAASWLTYIDFALVDFRLPTADVVVPRQRDVSAISVEDTTTAGEQKREAKAKPVNSGADTARIDRTAPAVAEAARWLDGLVVRALPDDNRTGDEQSAVEQATAVVACYFEQWTAAGRRPLTANQLGHLRSAVVTTWTTAHSWDLDDVRDAARLDAEVGMQDWTRSLRRLDDASLRTFRKAMAAPTGRSGRSATWNALNNYGEPYSHKDVSDRV